MRPADPPEPADVFEQLGLDIRGGGELKSARIVSAIEREILSGRLQPEQRLPTEDELSSLLGVSRTVVRDSMRALVARGLITTRQGRGPAVAAPTDSAYTNALLALLTRSGLSMGEIIAARATIEIGLVATAATAGTPAEWQRLAEVYEQFERAVAANDQDLATRSHALFHNTIVEAVHQPALTLMLTPMTTLTVVTGAASVQRASAADWEVDTHKPILDALRAGDGEAATKAMIAHYESSTRSTHYEAFLRRAFRDAYFDSPPGDRPDVNRADPRRAAAGTPGAAQ